MIAHGLKFTMVGMAAMMAACGLAAEARAQATSPPPRETRVVPTANGPVQGVVAGGVEEFLGIPYAAPPVGELRWRPPQAPAKKTETLAATHFANFCPQEQRGVFASPSVTEDCLYLNVFAPPPEAHGKPRPVMAWIHGGGMYSGESNDYDGAKLASRGGVIVVTLNYRLGALGFFSHPAINAEGHDIANYGIMDQQFALQWVKQNIAGFGGDPGNVTIFGQSGGATAILANLASPTAAGLFHRAISESGVRVAVYPPEDALSAAQDFAKTTGCADQSAACLRGLSVDQVLKNQAKIAGFVVTRFPMVDGKIITKTSFDAFNSGDFNKVPIMNGITHDEQAFFLAELNGGPALTADGYTAFIASFGAENTAALQARYPLASYPSPSEAEIGLARDFKGCTARFLDQTWSKYTPVYAYQFNDITAPSYFNKTSYPMGAYHTSELPYLFPMFHGGQGVAQPLNRAQQTLSNELVDYWTSFAKTGAPRLAKVTFHRWPRYNADKDNVQYLDTPITTANGYGKERDCALWDPMQAYRK